MPPDADLRIDAPIKTIKELCPIITHVDFSGYHMLFLHVVGRVHEDAERRELWYMTMALVAAAPTEHCVYQVAKHYFALATRDGVDVDKEDESAFTNLIKHSKRVLSASSVSVDAAPLYMASDSSDDNAAGPSSSNAGKSPAVGAGRQPRRRVMKCRFPDLCLKHDRLLKKYRHAKEYVKSKPPKDCGLNVAGARSLAKKPGPEGEYARRILL